MSLHNKIITEEEYESAEIESAARTMAEQQQQQQHDNSSIRADETDDCLYVDDAGTLHIRSNGVNFHVRILIPLSLE